jgi:indolepyruvate ferredoxin oxidoreductase beta subunit
MEFGIWSLEFLRMPNESGKNILFAGVGGQGILLVAELAARAAIHAGFDAKKTEVHGAAQRGGSVVSHVRFSPNVYSPLIPAGEADILLALEKLEGLRWAHFVRPGGLIVLNEEERVPAQLDGNRVEYPRQIDTFLAEKGFHTVLINATELATALGNYRAANTVLLGAIGEAAGIPMDSWMTVLKQNIPAKILEINLKAFEQGLDLARKEAWRIASSH